MHINSCGKSLYVPSCEVGAGEGGAEALLLAFKAALPLTALVSRTEHSYQLEVTCDVAILNFQVSTILKAGWIAPLGWQRP